jgi:hypothetical protein
VCLENKKGTSLDGPYDSPKIVARTNKLLSYLTDIDVLCIVNLNVLWGNKGLPDHLAFPIKYAEGAHRTYWVADQGGRVLIFAKSFSRDFPKLSRKIVKTLDPEGEFLARR